MGIWSLGKSNGNGDGEQLEIGGSGRGGLRNHQFSKRVEEEDWSLEGSGGGTHAAWPCRFALVFNEPVGTGFRDVVSGDARPLTRYGATILSHYVAVLR